MADQNESYSGDRKSLIYLTKNFVDIMKSSENGLLNLAYVSSRPAARILMPSGLTEPLSLVFRLAIS